MRDANTFCTGVNVIMILLSCISVLKTMGSTQFLSRVSHDLSYTLETRKVELKKLKTNIEYVYIGRGIIFSPEYRLT